MALTLCLPRLEIGRIEREARALHRTPTNTCMAVHLFLYFVLFFYTDTIVDRPCEDHVCCHERSPHLPPGA